MSDIADLRFSFKCGVLAIVNAIKDGEEPPEGDMQDWLEEKFQEFYKTYSQLQLMMDGVVDNLFSLKDSLQVELPPSVPSLKGGEKQ